MKDTDSPSGTFFYVIAVLLIVVVVLGVMWQHRANCVDRVEALPPAYREGFYSCSALEDACTCADRAELRYLKDKD